MYACVGYFFRILPGYALYSMHSILYTGLPLDFAITETANQTPIVSLFTTHKMQKHSYIHTYLSKA